MSVIRISQVEVTNINRRGFWLQCSGEDLYLPFAEFPQFEHASVSQICRIECKGPALLYWPGLGIDLSLDRIREPMAASHRRPRYNC
jgi:hypothetical protein